MLWLILGHARRNNGNFDGIVDNVMVCDGGMQRLWSAWLMVATTFLGKKSTDTGDPTDNHNYQVTGDWFLLPMKCLFNVLFNMFHGYSTAIVNGGSQLCLRR